MEGERKEGEREQRKERKRERYGEKEQKLRGLLAKVDGDLHLALEGQEESSSTETPDFCLFVCVCVCLFYLQRAP